MAKDGAEVRPTKKQKRETATNGIHPDRLRAIDAQEARNGKKSTPQKTQNENPSSTSAKHASILSKYSKSIKRSAALAQDKTGPTDAVDEPPRELHDLVPIPTPAREPTPEYRHTFSTLPEWLQKPVTVPSTERSPFTSLGVGEQTADHLKGKGYSKAFAVQCALVPRLMYLVNHTYARPNDICVSAPTGSGKTLGYALPIVEGLRRYQDDRKLRAVVVVPTRELVDQAVTTFRKCMAGSRLKIGTSTGNKSFAEEQQALIDQSSKYDPEEDQRLMNKAGKRQQLIHDSDGEHDLDDLLGAKLGKILKDALECEPGHVPVYSSAIDLLICTPGRLVEHIHNTQGFSLDHVEWLVIDEADRLLDQSFQDWVRVIDEALGRESSSNIQGSRMSAMFSMPKRYVRKVILSATMTRDISQLEALKLRRPTMIVVRTEEDEGNSGDSEQVTINDQGEYELPTGLTEHVIPVGDGSEKPLYLLEMLVDIFQGAENKSKSKVEADSDSDAESDTDASSEPSDSDSESEDGSDEDSDEGSDDDSDGDNDKDKDDDLDSDKDSDDDSQAEVPSDSSAVSTPQVLVFAASTSEAHRIHHLLSALLSSALSPSPHLTLLTKAHSSIGANVSAAKPRIIVSTDRASRGLDLPLSHVINYTIPRSLESYVHRVGRTARAGRSGHASSLVRDVEARWFWNEIGRASKVRRQAKVERTRRTIGKQWKDGKGKVAYQKALEEMARMVEKD